MNLRLSSVRAALLLLPLLSVGLCRAEGVSRADAAGEEEASLPVETQKSLEALVTMLGELARTLEAVVDAESASQHAAAVEYLIQELYATDYAAFEGGDEEVIAAGLESLFARIDQNMVRLDDADFYGNADLKRVFGADEGALHQLGQGSEESAAQEAPTAEGEETPFEGGATPPSTEGESAATPAPVQEEATSEEG